MSEGLDDSPAAAGWMGRFRHPPGPFRYFRNLDTGTRPYCHFDLQAGAMLLGVRGRLLMADVSRRSYPPIGALPVYRYASIFSSEAGGPGSSHSSPALLTIRGEPCLQGTAAPRVHCLRVDVL